MAWSDAARAASAAARRRRAKGKGTQSYKWRRKKGLTKRGRRTRQTNAQRAASIRRGARYQSQQRKTKGYKTRVKLRRKRKK